MPNHPTPSTSADARPADRPRPPVKSDGTDESLSWLDELIEQSLLGSPGARQLRRRIDPDLARQLVGRAGTVKPVRFGATPGSRSGQREGEEGMAERTGSPGRDVAVCRFCSRPIAREPGSWWKHTTGSQQFRCAPGTRNASLAAPIGGWHRQ